MPIEWRDLTEEEVGNVTCWAIWSDTLQKFEPKMRFYWAESTIALMDEDVSG